MTQHIHPTAIIEKGAVIGENVTIGPFGYIDQDVFVGDNCIIGPRVTILRYTTLGKNCRVHCGAVLGDLPQDTNFGGERSYVIIGSNCLIREGVTIHRGTQPESATKVGNGCFLMGFSHCAHNVTLGEKVVLANGVLLGGYAEVGDGAFLGGNAGVHQFVRIGRLSMLGGACAVSKDVLPFMTVRSSQLNVLAGLNNIGLQRGGITIEERRDIKRTYTLLFKSNLTVKEAIQKVRGDLKTQIAEEICVFIESSVRGFCRASRGGK